MQSQVGDLLFRWRSTKLYFLGRQDNFTKTTIHVAGEHEATIVVEVEQVRIQQDVQVRGQRQTSLTVTPYRYLPTYHL